LDISLSAPEERWNSLFVGHYGFIEAERKAPCSCRNGADPIALGEASPCWGENASFVPEQIP